VDDDEVTLDFFDYFDLIDREQGYPEKKLKKNKYYESLLKFDVANQTELERFIFEHYPYFINIPTGETSASSQVKWLTMVRVELDWLKELDVNVGTFAEELLSRNFYVKQRIAGYHHPTNEEIMKFNKSYDRLRREELSPESKEPFCRHFSKGATEAFFGPKLKHTIFLTHKEYINIIGQTIERFKYLADIAADFSDKLYFHGQRDSNVGPFLQPHIEGTMLIRTISAYLERVSPCLVEVFTPVDITKKIKRPKDIIVGEFAHRFILPEFVTSDGKHNGYLYFHTKDSYFRVHGVDFILQAYFELYDAFRTKRPFIKCLVCDKPFQRGMKTKYCGQTCQDAARSKYMQERYGSKEYREIRKNWPSYPEPKKKNKKGKD